MKYFHESNEILSLENDEQRNLWRLSCMCENLSVNTRIALDTISPARRQVLPRSE